MRTTTIRVAEKTRDRLNELARRRGEPAGEVVAALVQEADDRALLAAALGDWQRLSDDAEAIAAYRAESRDLEAFDAPVARLLSPDLRQGDVVWADPDPTRGSERAKARPFAIVSVDQLNRSGLGISLVLPFTRTDFSNALHLAIVPPDGGLRERSFAMPEQLRVLAHERVSRRLGTLRPATLSQLLRRCRLLLGETA